MTFCFPRETKSLAQVRKELHLSCTVPGCSNPLTTMKGYGQGVLCREHQGKLIEYGGVGRLDRLWTFHRKWVCDECGVDVSVEVVKKFPGLDTKDPTLFNRLCRNRIIGDHQVRKADGGLDTESNIKSLCLNCNADKTIINEDWRSGEKQINQPQGN
jgi:5-methylcytosine-specific restriction endonuclease McrA